MHTYSVSFHLNPPIPSENIPKNEKAGGLVIFMEKFISNTLNLFGFKNKHEYSYWDMSVILKVYSEEDSEILEKDINKILEPYVTVESIRDITSKEN